MRLIYSDEEAASEKLKDVFVRAAAMCVAREGMSHENMEVSVTFASKDEIRRLNRDYRGIDTVTDVLSFPLIEDIDALPACDDDDDGEEIMLGDVVICVEKGKEQAREYGHSVEREIVYLFVHSMYHLLGYDHMNDDDKNEMRRHEEDVMSAIELRRDEDDEV